MNVSEMSLPSPDPSAHSHAGIIGLDFCFYFCMHVCVHVYMCVGGVKIVCGDWKLTPSFFLNSSLPF